MMKTVGLYLLSFSSYWKNSRTHRLFGWDTYCSAPTMGLLSTSEVKVLYWKVALVQWQCEDIKARCKYHRKRRTFSTFFKKSEKFSISFWKWGGGLSHPSLSPADPVLTFSWTQGCTMQSLAALALTGTECIKNKQTHKHTNTQTFFFIYIDWFDPILLWWLI